LSLRRVQVQTRRFEDVKTMMRQCSSATASAQQAYNWAALCLQMERMEEAALPYLERAFRLQPDSMMYAAAYGQQLQQLKRYAEAIEPLERLTRMRFGLPGDRALSLPAPGLVEMDLDVAEFDVDAFLDSVELRDKARRVSGTEERVRTLRHLIAAFSQMGYKRRPARTLNALRLLVALSPESSRDHGQLARFELVVPSSCD
jgi:tetratricopeptide (TPR) repeat protein